MLLLKSNFTEKRSNFITAIFNEIKLEKKKKEKEKKKNKKLNRK